MNGSISEFAHVLSQKLLSRNWSITCVESCTGGGVAYALTEVSGSSAWFNQGWVTYANQAKESLVEVNAGTLSIHGAVSEQTVIEMCQGALRLAKANVSIATSGIAGPSGGSPQKPVGTVWFGISINGKVHSKVQVFAGNRQQVRLAAIEFALVWVNQLIESEDS